MKSGDVVVARERGILPPPTRALQRLTLRRLYVLVPPIVASPSSANTGAAERHDGEQKSNTQPLHTSHLPHLSHDLRRWVRAERFDDDGGST
jgi:hypothetical protein